MSSIDYTWLATAPHKPDVYVTRRNTSKIHSTRYWDGKQWFDISTSGTASRGGSTPFKWPKKPRVSMGWYRRYEDVLSLRKITDQAAIQWGTPFRVYDDKEVLAYLVKSGRLPADWRTAYQETMRAADYREIRE